MRKDKARGVSVTVGYPLNLAIATVLFSALLVGGSGLIDSQTRTVTRDELSVTGQQLAAELSDADRLVRAGDESAVSEISVRSELPERTAAGSYTVDIDHTGTGGTIVLETRSPRMTVTVPFRSETAIENTTVDGGPISIEYDVDAEQLVVSSE
jgi:hypothetical protein